MEGTMKFFNANKGFGFVSDDEGNDYFVHATEVQPEGTMLNEGDKVEFEPSENERGKLAKNVKLV